jgi:hypothetical protein
VRELQFAALLVNGLGEPMVESQTRLNFSSETVVEEGACGREALRGGLHLDTHSCSAPPTSVLQTWKPAH